MKGTMRAIVKSKPEVGAEFKKDWPIPQIGPKDLLVKVKASAICGSDVHIWDWTPFAQARLKLPMSFGHEFCGEVTEMGERVEGFEIGELVAGETHIPCGQCYQCKTGLQHICQNMKILGIHTQGAFADYMAMPAVCAWKLPKGFNPEMGAILEPIGVGTHGALVGPVGAKTVAVLGCGPIGCFAIGVVKACGALKIYASDISDMRLEIAKKMGATITYNADKVDVTAEILKDTDGCGVDVVLDVSGAPGAIKTGVNVVRKAGRFTFVGIPDQQVVLDIPNEFIYKETEVKGITGRVMWETWFQVTNLLSSGLLKVDPVITHRFPLEGFQEAFENVKHRRGGKVLFIH
jgi:threonine 3-dehydrogenase